MIVHIFNDQKKFSLGFFRFLKDEGFDLKDTRVWHYGKPSAEFEKTGVKIRFIRSWLIPPGHGRMYRELKQADRIIIHSLASPFLIGMLRMNRKLCEKTWWVIWGKDLYLYRLSRKKSLPLKLYEAFRKPVMRDIRHIISALPGDYELARKWYGSRADYTPLPMLYPYCIDYGQGAKAEAAPEKMTILVGNSASRTNEHEEAIRILAESGGEHLGKVYCPLSYGGPKKYAGQVAAYGREKLGDRFIPLMDYMPFEEYRKIWNSADAAVYNQKRQEALGNIYSLIMMKKTVYLRPGTSTADYMEAIGVRTPAFREGCRMEALDPETRERNAERLLAEIRPEKSREAWARVLQPEREKETKQ